MKKVDVLIRTNSDEDRKILRAELKRHNIKYNENDEKVLTNYLLTEENLNTLDISKVNVFQNVIVNNISKNVRMLVQQNPIKWDR